jgi:hypothetical protein
LFVDLLRLVHRTRFVSTPLTRFLSILSAPRHQGHRRHLTGKTELKANKTVTIQNKAGRNCWTGLSERSRPLPSATAASKRGALSVWNGQIVVYAMLTTRPSRTAAPRRTAFGYEVAPLQRRQHRRRRWRM